MIHASDDDIRMNNCFASQIDGIVQQAIKKQVYSSYDVLNEWMCMRARARARKTNYHELCRIF